MKKLKLKLNNITGIVALSYLLLIPAAGLCLWSLLQQLDREMAEHAKMLGELREDRQFEENRP